MKLVPFAKFALITRIKNQQTMAKKATKSFILRVDSEKWAADEFRSTNGQLQWIITEALRKARRLPKKKKSETDNQEDNNDET